MMLKQVLFESHLMGPGRIGESKPPTVLTDGWQNAKRRSYEQAPRFVVKYYLTSSNMHPESMFCSTTKRKNIVKS